MQGRRRKEPDLGEQSLLDVPEADGRRSGARRVSVMLPYPFPGPFDYRIPPDLHPQPGDVVLVPLNRREEVGVVWDHSAEDGVPDHKLKPLSGLIDSPPMRPALRRFIDWVASYTLSAPGEVLAMALRVVPQGVNRPPTGWVRADPLPGTRITEARNKVLEALASKQPRTTGELAGAAGVGTGVVRGMADAGLLVPAALPLEPPFAYPDPDNPGEILAVDQAAAGAALRRAVAEQTFSVTLLDGVTGSGKTETYLEAVAECLRQGRQALVLLPEIALSSQWLRRSRRGFGLRRAVWPWALTWRVRRVTWRGLGEVRAPFFVGARSAFFLPFPTWGSW